MTTGPALAHRPADLPPTIQLYAQSLTPRECDEHRAWIGIRVEALMDGYWQTRPTDLVKREILSDWMDALQNYAPEEIRAACREYLAGADCARKPKPGDIKAIIQEQRRIALLRHRAAQPRAPEPVPVLSDEDLERRRRFAAQTMADFELRHSVNVTNKAPEDC